MVPVLIQHAAVNTDGGKFLVSNVTLGRCSLSVFIVEILTRIAVMDVSLNSVIVTNRGQHPNPISSRQMEVVAAPMGILVWDLMMETAVPSTDGAVLQKNTVV
jgi:hypothetical protein